MHVRMKLTLAFSDSQPSFLRPTLLKCSHPLLDSSQLSLPHFQLCLLTLQHFFCDARFLLLVLHFKVEVLDGICFKVSDHLVTHLVPLSVIVTLVFQLLHLLLFLLIVCGQVVHFFLHLRALDILLLHLLV